MNSIPSQFLMVTHEGITKVAMSFELIQNMDNLLATFSADKMALIPRVAFHPFGYQHAVIWTGRTPRTWAVLELTTGKMVLATQYQAASDPDTGASWVYPCFVQSDSSFPLRCLFDFEVWATAGLRMFLGLNFSNTAAHLWVYYSGQIYRPPFGNIFESTSQICLGANKAQYDDIFRVVGQPAATSITKTIQLLSDSTWNHDTFHPRNLPILRSTVRFDSSNQELPMLPPLELPIIKKASVASAKELVDITTNIVAIYG